MTTQPAAEAVEQLIRAYGRLVFHLIHGMVHDWHESEDLTQEVFLSAFRGIDAARTARGAEFQARAWLLHIAVNRVRMYRRRQRLMHFVPFSHLETAEAGADAISELAAPVQPGGYCTVEGGGDPASLVAERDAIRRALAGLPDPLRLPLLLSVVGGLSGAEIARILGVGETAIRQRLSRARKNAMPQHVARWCRVRSPPQNNGVSLLRLALACRWLSPPSLSGHKSVVPVPTKMVQPRLGKRADFSAYRLLEHHHTTKAAASVPSCPLIVWHARLMTS